MVITYLLVEIVHILGLLDRGGGRIFYNLVQEIRHQIGILPLGIIIGFIVFVILFFILSRRPIRYLGEISRAVEKISLGNFEIEIPRKTSDELGDLAENINRMTTRLKSSIEEERNADRSKNELITSVSHDLRTPLTSVLGYMELIEKDKYRDEVELRRYADVAYEKTLRMRQLIDDLFEYTKVNFGGLKIKASTIDMKELLEQLVEEFVPALREAKMECHLAVPETKCLVPGDGDLLVRVFENLVSNAVRYGESGETIAVDLAADDAWIVIRVVNHGRPISSIDLPHVFERFYRVDGSRSDQTGGAGLGLAIAKGIVDLHGGTITVASDERETVFEVKLPSIASAVS